MTFSSNHDPAELYQVDKAAWQQMRKHESNPDVAAYQQILLQGKDNVVCTQMYDVEGPEHRWEWAQGVQLLLCRGLSVVQGK